MFSFLKDVPPGGLLFWGNELNFRYPGRLVLAAMVLLFAVVVLWDWRRRRRALRVPMVAIHLSTSRVPTIWQSIRWWAWFSAAIVLLVVAYANPEVVISEADRVFGKIRITFILDVSRSMEMAEDVKPNRLEAARSMVRDLVLMLERDPELKGKYALALIPFRGTALPYFLPFTISRDEFFSNLDRLDSQTVTKKGSSLWSALRAFDELLLEYPAEERGTVDLGVLVSDGGKEEGKSERPLLPQLVKELRDPHRAILFLSSGQRVFVRSREPQRSVLLLTLGVGAVEVNREGRRVAKPAALKIRDKAGNLMGYWHVKEGDVTSPLRTSTLDEEVLRELADLGGGKYHHLADREIILREFKNQILSHRVETGRISRKSYRSLRAWFLFPAFLVLYFLFGYGGWIMRLGRRMIVAMRGIFTNRTTYRAA